MFDAYLNHLENRATLGLKRTLKHLNTPYVLDFSSNDALNLSEHATVKATLKHSTYPFKGSGGSRLLCENQALFEEVEKKIAALKGTETALLFASGFQANVTVLEALLDARILNAKPLVFTDKYIHASMHMGCQLAQVKQIRFHHQDLNHLSDRLDSFKKDNNPKFILVESLYSMEGDVTAFEPLVALAKKHHAFLYVDEAHATGLYGPKGGGFSFPFAQDIPCVLGTFSKALGSFGAFIACSQSMKDYLINRCQGLIYSTALPLSLLNTYASILDLLPSLEKERRHLKTLSDYTHERLLSLPYRMTPSNSHVFGLIIPDLKEA